jgi:RNA polymerase sigma-70 factor, ECF subfamily
MEFVEQLEALRPNLLKTLLRAGAKDDAEDVVQDALMMALRKRDQFRGESALATWVTRIALHCFWMRLRGKMKRATVNIDPELEKIFENTADCAASPLQRVIARERTRSLVRAIATLPVGQRSILTRQLLLDASYKELSAAFGTTESNMKSQAFKGRAKVREILMEAGA